MASTPAKNIQGSPPGAGREAPASAHRKWQFLRVSLAGLAFVFGCTESGPSEPAASATSTPHVRAAVVKSESTEDREGTAEWLREATADFGLGFVHESGATGELHLVEITGGGAALFDYDEDGDLDLYLVNSGPDPLDPDADRSAAPNRLFRNDENRRLTDVTDASGLGDQGYGLGVAVGDIDNDGWADVYITNFGPDRLYRNLGGEKFTDISDRAGIRVGGWSSSAAFFDYDRDGDLDLFVAQYVRFDRAKQCFDWAGQPDYCGPLAYPPVPDVLLRNDGDGTFTDVSEAAGISSLAAAGLGVICEDFDEDGWPDVYVANDGYANHLWTNRPDGTFTDDALVLGAAYNLHGHAEAGMGVVCGDFDHNGTLDLFMTHLRRETNTLYSSLGAGRGFVDATGASGLGVSSTSLTGFGIAAFDIDLDGSLDIFVANGRVARADALPGVELAPPWDRYAEPNLLYRNDGQGRFRCISEYAPALCQRCETSRGVAVGDIDGDGDPDLVVTNIQGPARLFLNEAPRRGRSLLVEARDPRLRRHAIGARVTLHIGDSKQVRTVRRSGSYLTSNDPAVHFGVPEAALARMATASLEVHWPDGLRERFPLPEWDGRITLVRGTGVAQP